MRNIFFLSLILLLSSTINFSQTAKKIDDVSDNIPYGEMMAKIDSYHQELREKLSNKLYVIYYEGKKRLVSVYNPQTKKDKSTLENPRFGNALNKAKEIPLYLKMAYKVPSNKTVLIDGGFREEFSLEVWLVPEGAEIPKATPTVNRKDVKFSKKKPRGIRKIALCYEGY